MSGICKVLHAFATAEYEFVNVSHVHIASSFCSATLAEQL